VLAGFAECLPKFVKIMPRDYKRVLLDRIARRQEQESADVELAEVSNG
jgi:glutamate synthase domain-containing protein 3